MPWVAAVTTVAGGAYSAYNQKKAGKAEKKAAYRNASLMEAEADQGYMEDREEIRRQRMRNIIFRGSQRAVVAQSGVVGNTGSPLDALAETAALQEMEIQDASRTTDSRHKLGYAQADEMRRSGKLAYSAAKRQAVGTLFNTAATTARIFA